MVCLLLAGPAACLAIADVGDLRVVEEEAIGAGGHACAEASDCPELSVDCLGWTCPDGICERIDLPEGTACDDNDGQWCNGEGQCVECVADAQCMSSHFCLLANFTCQPDRPDGAACARDEQCQSGYCNDYRQQCEPWTGP